MIEITGKLIALFIIGFLVTCLVTWFLYVICYEIYKNYYPKPSRVVLYGDGKYYIEMLSSIFPYYHRSLSFHSNKNINPDFADGSAKPFNSEKLAFERIDEYKNYFKVKKKSRTREKIIKRKFSISDEHQLWEQIKWKFKENDVEGAERLMDKLKSIQEEMKL